MKIHIYNNARSFIVSYWNEDASWEDPNPYSIIDAAVEAADNEIDVRQQALGAHIIDAETGKIYVTCYRDENDIPEEDYGVLDDYALDCLDHMDDADDDYWDDGCPIDDVDESNYDPYAGCDMYEVEPMDFGW